MFRKLVSNLAFSPALVGQLGFYAKRLRKEETTRRVGLIFTVLALIMQSFAIFSPPEAANASNPSNFIQGGVSSITDYLHNYDQNTNNIQDLFTVLGITRANVASAQLSSVNSKDVYSWGLTSHFSAAQGERTYTIRTASGGLRTFYYRPLSLWDTTSYTIPHGSTYQAYVGTSSTGMYFSLMKVCGNLLLKVIPPAPKCPTGMVGIYPDCSTPPAMCVIPGKTNLPASSPDCVKTTVVPCAFNPNLTKDNPDCQPCPGDTTIWIKDAKCTPSVQYSKAATNVTQSGIDATTKVANAGDSIIYTLNVKNSGNAPATLNIADNLTDVSEYANIADAGGGTYNATTKTLTWPQFDVGPNSTQSRMFTIKILDQIPAVGTGVSDKTSYDCRIDNTFGNTVEVAVNCPVQKQIVEQTVNQLPHTGPRENMLLAGMVLSVVTFFYARTRQMKKEVRLIRRDLNAGTI